MTQEVPSPTMFEVITHDDNGEPVRCSYCARRVPSVVVLPITSRPELDEVIKAAENEMIWMGLCAYCVLAMAKALATAQNSNALEVTPEGAS